VADKHSVGLKEQQQVKNVHGLHRPEQGLPKGFLPPAEH